MLRMKSAMAAQLLQAPLFDVYVVVDWSAASVPRLGKDSIWYCVLTRGNKTPAAIDRKGDSVAREESHLSVSTCKGWPSTEDAEQTCKRVKLGLRKKQTRGTANREGAFNTAELEANTAVGEVRERRLYDQQGKEMSASTFEVRRCDGGGEWTTGLEVDQGGAAGSKSDQDGAPFATCRVENVATRAQAEEELRQMAVGWVKGGRRVLLGFDFSFAFPRGFAAALGLPVTMQKGTGVGDTPRAEAAPAPLPSAPWRLVWDYLGEHIRDLPTNGNNRFEVAAEMNRLVSGAQSPFWGCPPSQASPFLGPKKAPVSGGPRGGEGKGQRVREERQLSERREAEARCGAQPSWKLFTTGAVGSQSLLGIPRLRALRDDKGLSWCTRVWPFETGLQPPRPAPPQVPPGGPGPTELRTQEPLVVLAEVYPSLVEPLCEADEPKDAGQVRALARHFADLDSKGRLSELFRGPHASRSAENPTALRQRKAPRQGTGARGGEGPLEGEEVDDGVIVEEEGWILGVI